MLETSEIDWQLLWIFGSQQVQAHMIIIIHPGSLNLRIGRASDLNPHRILNVIARRRKPGGGIHRDAVLPPSIVKVSAPSSFNVEWKLSRRTGAKWWFLCFSFDFSRIKSKCRKSKRAGCKYRIPFSQVCSRMDDADMRRRHNKLLHSIADQRLN